MAEHPLIRAVGGVLRGRDSLNTRPLLAALEQWLSKERTTARSGSQCFMCTRGAADVSVFTSVIEQENGNAWWQIGTTRDPLAALCEVCVRGCRRVREQQDEEPTFGHIVATLRRSGEEALAAQVGEAYASPRIWSVIGRGYCVACRELQEVRYGTAAVSFCAKCLGHFQVPPLKRR